MTSLWHGFSAMGSDTEPLTLVRGEGATVWDDAGNAYLDATAGLWYCNIGHGRTEIADAAARQMRLLAGYQTYEHIANPPASELAGRLASLVPFDGARVFFTPGGGSDAVDTAAKLARAYWRTLDRPDKRVMVCRTGAYHGMNAFGTSLGGIAVLVEASGPLVGEVERVAWDDAHALRELLERLGPDRVAAFFCEPVIGAGGVLHPPEGYLAEVAAICRDADVLLVVDEVITGFGRLGRRFACDRFGLEPDLLVLAKGLTSGYLPLGAVVAGARVAEPFWDADSGAMFRHGYTYAGHPAACAAALANLDVLERERLIERVAELEPVLADVVRPLAAHPLVADVRAGLGLMAAVELERPELVPRAVAELRARGVLTRPFQGGRALQLSPSFVVSQDELATIADAIGDALEACAAVETGTL